MSYFRTNGRDVNEEEVVAVVASTGAIRSRRPRRDILSSKSSGTVSIMSQELNTDSMTEEEMETWPGWVLWVEQ